jgi:hypothetical protein
MAPVKTYARKTLTRCEAGDLCECVNKSVLDLLYFYSSNLARLENRRYGGADNFQHFLEKLTPCFLRIIRRVTYDVLRGRIILDDRCSSNPPKILEHKQAALNICHPGVPNRLALQRLLEYNRTLPAFFYIWAECVYDVRHVIDV